MKAALMVGLEHTFTYRVPVEKTVPFVFRESELFQEMPSVFATAFMVGFIEWACMEALEPYLEEGERTLGTLVNVSHQAATPPGMLVTAHVRLLELAGKRTLWDIEVRDEVEIISKGIHERYVVDGEKFSARVASKQAK